jgi:hypothetical protein
LNLLHNKQTRDKCPDLAYLNFTCPLGRAIVRAASRVPAVVASVEDAASETAVALYSAVAAILVLFKLPVSEVAVSAVVVAVADTLPVVPLPVVVTLPCGDPCHLCAVVVAALRRVNVSSSLPPIVPQGSARAGMPGMPWRDQRRGDGCVTPGAWSA